jgi:hypothetical protein
MKLFIRVFFLSLILWTLLGQIIVRGHNIKIAPNINEYLNPQRSQILLAQNPSKTQVKTPELWFSANLSASDFYTIFEPSKAFYWSELKDKVSVFKFYRDTLAPNNIRGFATPQLANAINFLKKNNIRIAVEVGGTLGNKNFCDRPNLGEESAKTEYKKISNLIKLGAQIDYIVLDGPISRTIKNGRAKNCEYSLDRSINELINYLNYMHDKLPKTQFGLLVNFPNWTYNGIRGNRVRSWAGIDYADVLKQVFSKTDKAGVSFSLFEIDNPWDYLEKNPINARIRLQQLVSQAKSFGKQVNIIANTDRGWHNDHNRPFPNTLTPTQKKGKPRFKTLQDRYRDFYYQRDTLSFIYYILCDLQETVDAIVIQSWHIVPFSIFPPNENGTLSNNLSRSFNIVRRGTCKTEPF